MFEESTGAKKTFGDINKARIYLNGQRIRGVDPVSKWVWSVFIQNLCILSRGDESNCYTRGNVTSWLCFYTVPEELRKEGRGVLAYYWGDCLGCDRGSFLYRFDKLKRGQYYEKGRLPCLRASIFDRDTELLSSARCNSDKWWYLIVCYAVFRSLVKRIAHTRMLCFVLIGYVSLNGRYFNLKYPLTEKIRDTRWMFGYKADSELMMSGKLR